MRKSMVVVCSACLLVGRHGAAAKVSLGADFINGFEAGVIVRDDDNAFYDYSCEKPKGDSYLAEQA